MTKDFSADAIGDFYQWAIEKGLMKQETARARKIATLKVLGALDESEREDVRTVDRDAAFNRFVNKFGRDFTPQSLTAYRGRFMSGMDDFIRYKENPANFRFDTAQRKARVGSGEETAEKPTPVKRTFIRTGVAPAQTPVANVHEIVFPIPIRQGVVVRVHNLPNDLTKAEAQRIAAVITALAVIE